MRSCFIGLQLSPCSARRCILKDAKSLAKMQKDLPRKSASRRNLEFCRAIAVWRVAEVARLRSSAPELRPVRLAAQLTATPRLGLPGLGQLCYKPTLPG